MAPLSIAPAAGEPLAAWFSPARSERGLVQQRFECTSRGDRVSGRLWQPAAAARAPLVLAVHELSRDASDPALDSAARGWAASGYATAAIDLPLHGERHNAKLSRRALNGAAGGVDEPLWAALLSQAVCDLARALDALAAAARADLEEVASVAFGGSEPIALAHAALDARVGQIAVFGTPRPLRSELAKSPAKSLRWLAKPDDLASWLASARAT